MKALASLVVGAVLTAQPPQMPTFKARVDLVRVDALVVDDGRPIEGLKASDFVIRDNGVEQTVESIQQIAEVTAGVVLDVSGSMSGERLKLAAGAASQLLNEIEDRDRFALLAFDDQVAVIADSGTSMREATVRLENLSPGGTTAMLDATYAGVVQSDLAAGPKLLLVMTDGRENISWLRARDVIDAARRREAVIYPVAVGLGPKTVVHRGGRSVNDAARLLEIVADDTGGRLVEADWETDLKKIFTAILREFRQRYVLGFAPRGVPTGDGWHTLEVKVKRHGANVRARSGYWAGRK